MMPTVVAVLTFVVLLVVGRMCGVTTELVALPCVLLATFLLLVVGSDR